MTQFERENGWYSYRFNAAPVLISGSNILNCFTTNYKSVNWVIDLDYLPDFMHMRSKSGSIEALEKQLELLLAFV